jgi:hypothetical protein
MKLSLAVSGKELMISCSCSAFMNWSCGSFGNPGLKPEQKRKAHDLDHHSAQPMSPTDERLTSRFGQALQRFHDHTTVSAARSSVGALTCKLFAAFASLARDQQ